ncbi:hypothetical protein IWQ61_003137 [Dispira simplex]|nr:hypothetical protein IWQ61_003137 [Dispira simplex]
MAQPPLPSIAELEALCSNLYNAVNVTERTASEEKLQYYFPTFTARGPTTKGDNLFDSNATSTTEELAMVGFDHLVPPATNTVSDLQKFFDQRPHGFQSVDKVTGHSTTEPNLVVTCDPAVATPVAATERLFNLLSVASSPYAHIFAISQLRTLFRQYFTGFTLDEKSQARLFLLEFLARDPQRPPFITKVAAQVLALVTKVAWFDAATFRTVTSDMEKWAERGIPHYTLALQCLIVLVEETNRESATRYSAKERKMAVSFRDTQLLKIFQLAYKSLRFVIGESPGPLDKSAYRFLELTLELIQTCLRFDFVGLAPDESSDDTTALQIPMAWKVVIHEPTFLDIFFTAYPKVEPPLSATILDCLGSLASIRRSFFTEPPRTTYLKTLLVGLLDIMTLGQGLGDADNYLALCRLLARFRSVYTFSDVEDVEQFIPFMERTTQLGMEGLAKPSYAPLSVTSILSFWSKVCTTRSRDEALLKQFKSSAHRLLNSYLAGILSAVPDYVEDPSENPLREEDSVTENLSLVADIARFDYIQSVDLVLQHYQPLLTQYRQLLEQGNRPGAVFNSTSANVPYNVHDLRIVEEKLAWLVYVVSALVGGRVPYQSTEEDDARDGEVTAHMFQLVPMLEERIRQLDTTHAETIAAGLQFLFRQFRTTYISDQSYGVPKAFGQLGRILGLENKEQIMGFILQTIIRTLELFPPNSPLVTKAVGTLNEFTLGYSSLRLLANLDTAHSLLRNHASSTFAFLQTVDYPKNQLIYYNALAKLLFVEDAAEGHFQEFIAPWNTVLEEICHLDEHHFAQDPGVKVALHRLFYHLRGLLFSIQSRKNLMFFFDWIYPLKLKLVERAVRTWPGDPIQVTALKFWLEFVYNRSQRLNFDVSSAYGVLIFRETSRLLQTYYQSIAGKLTQVANSPTVEGVDKYKRLYKGVMVSIDILSRSLSGRYIAFGVFALYKDDSLEKAVRTCLEFIVTIPNCDVLAYPKLTRAVYSFFENLTDERTLPLITLNQTSYLILMRLVVQGLYSTNVGTVNMSCNILDNLCQFIGQQNQRATSASFLSSPIRTDTSLGLTPPDGNSLGKSPGQSLDFANLPMSPPVPLSLAMGGTWNPPQQQHSVMIGYRMYPNVMPFMLIAVINTLLFEVRPNQWSLSRALFGLVNLQKQEFVQYIEFVVQYQTPDKQEVLVKEFRELFDAVGPRISSTYCDRFCKKMTEVCKALTVSNVVLIPPASAPPQNSVTASVTPFTGQGVFSMESTEMALSREKTIRDPIPVAWAMKQWTTLLDHTASCTADMETTSDLVQWIVYTKPLRAFIESTHGTWDQQSHWLKQLDSQLRRDQQRWNSQLNQTLPRAYLHWLREGLVPVIVQAFFLAGEIPQRRLCIAILQTCQHLFVGLDNRVSSVESRTVDPKAGEATKSEEMSGCVRVLSDELVIFLGMGNAQENSNLIDPIYLGESVQLYSNIPLAHRADAVQMLCEFPLGKSVVVRWFSEIIAIFSFQAYRETLSLLGRPLPQLPGTGENQASELPITSSMSRAEQLEALKKVLRTFQTLLALPENADQACRLNRTSLFLTSEQEESLRIHAMAQLDVHQSQGFAAAFMNPASPSAFNTQMLLAWLTGYWVEHGSMFTSGVTMGAGMVSGLLVRFTPSDPSEDNQVTFRKVRECLVGWIQQAHSDLIRRPGDPAVWLPSMCIIRGCLVYLHRDQLLTPVPPLDPLIDKPQPLLSFIFTYLCDVCDRCQDFQHRVLIFETLVSWVSRLKSSLQQLPSDGDIAFPTTTPDDSNSLYVATQQLLKLATDPSTTETLLCYVWNHWDDPVDAIQHKVRALFEGIMDIGEQYLIPTVNEDAPCDNPFTHQLLQRIISLGWQQKVKYSLLALVATRTGTLALFDADGSLLDSSLVHIHDPMIRPRVTELHLTLLKQGQSELSSSTKSSRVRTNWTALWVHAYYRALTSPNSVTRKNTATLVLPTLLGLFPETLDALVAHLQGKPTAHPNTIEENDSEGTSTLVGETGTRLHGLLALYKTAKTLDLIPATVDGPGESDHKQRQGLSILPRDQLLAALHHADRDVRLDLLGILCEARKSTQEITGQELYWLKAFISANLQCPYPDFRQKFTAAINKLLIRLRGNCYMWERERLHKLRWLAKLMERFGIGGGIKPDSFTSLTTHSPVFTQLQRLVTDPHTLAHVTDTSKDSANTLATILPTLQQWRELERKIAMVRKFLEWLIELCLSSMYPSSSFPRLTVGLKLYILLFEIFGVDRTPPPDGYVAEASAGHGVPNFPFRLPLVSPQAYELLWHTLSTSYEENRLNAFRILANYFPMPLSEATDLSSPEENVIANYVRQACSQLTSSRADDTETGALSLRLIFSKCIRHQTSIATVNRWFPEVPCPGEVAPLLPDVSAECNVPGARFVEHLVTLAQTYCHIAETNLLQAASHFPIHGVLVALRMLLEECDFAKHAQRDPDDWFKEVPAWRKVIRKLLTVIDRVARVVMEILSNASPEGNLPASFDEVGKTLDELVGAVTQKDPTLVEIGPKHQVILSYCWRAIKEASALLSTVIVVVPAPDTTFIAIWTRNHPMPPGRSVDELWMLDIPTVVYYADVLRDWLLAIRHSGAFSAVHPAFALVCKRFLTSGHTLVSQVPTRWLDECLTAIVTRTVSVTRRSAGLPLCIVSIVGAEPSQTHQLLESTAEWLFNLAFRPVGQLPTVDNTRAESINEQSDIPQVHAFNILRKLFADTTLNLAMLSYVQRGFELAVFGFTSEAWAIRNCAVMLFSSLLNKTFGMKSVRTLGDADTIDTWESASMVSGTDVTYGELDIQSSGCHSLTNPLASANGNSSQQLTGREFFNRFPRLYPFLYQELKNATESLIKVQSLKQPTGPPTLHPALFPILLLLSHLQTSVMQVTPESTVYDLQKFIALVEACSGSPVYKIREMAARALVALVPSTELVHYTYERCCALHNLVVMMYTPTLTDGQASLTAASESTNVSWNAVHGILCQIHELLRSPHFLVTLCHPRLALEFMGNIPDILLGILQSLLSTFTNENGCPPLVDTTALKVLRAMWACFTVVKHTVDHETQPHYRDDLVSLQAFLDDAEQSHLTLVSRLVHREFFSDSTRNCQPGGGVYGNRRLETANFARSQELAQLVLRLSFSPIPRRIGNAGDTGSSQFPQTQSVLHTCLTHPSYEVQLVTLRFLYEIAQSTHPLFPTLTQQLNWDCLVHPLLTSLHKQIAHPVVLAHMARLLNLVQRTLPQLASAPEPAAVEVRAIHDVLWIQARDWFYKGQRYQLLSQLVPYLASATAQQWRDALNPSSSYGTPALKEYPTIQVDLRKQLEIWSKLVWQMSVSSQPLPVRMAAADCLTPALSILFNHTTTLYQPSATHSATHRVLSDCLARFFIGLIRLLQDDDEDIRTLMASAVSVAVLTQEDTGVTPVYALDLTMHCLTHRYSDAPWILVILWYCMNGSLELTQKHTLWVQATSMDSPQVACLEWLTQAGKRIRGLIENVAEDSSTLFAEEKRNMFIEEPRLIQLAHRTLCKLAHSMANETFISAMPPDFYQMVLQAGQDVFNEIKQLTVDERGIATYRGLTHKPLFFLELYQILVQVITLLRCPLSKVDVDPTRWLVLLNDLNGLPHHPVIRKLLYGQGYTMETLVRQKWLPLKEITNGDKLWEAISPDTSPMLNFWLSDCATT